MVFALRYVRATSLFTIMAQALTIVALATFAVPDGAISADKWREFREAVEWFETLEDTHAFRAPFVSVTVRERGVPATESRSVTTHGFVLARHRNTYTVLTLNLRRIEVTALDADATLVVDQVQLREYAEGVLRDGYQQAAVPFCWEMGQEFGSFRRPLDLSPFSLDFVLATACLQNDIDDLAMRLAARSVETKLMLAGDGDELRLQLVSEWCSTFTDRATAALANKANSRRQVLSQVQWIIENFPDRPERREAERMSRILQRMIAEDDARLRKIDIPGSPSSSTPEELVHFLRDQTARDNDRRIFDGFSGVEPGYKSPAEQLLELGREAVPALIEAVGDDGFTRIVGNANLVPHFVECVPIGRCAYHLLIEIWGETPPGSYSPFSDDPADIERTQRILRQYAEEQR